MSEIWKDIDGCYPYQVSNIGRVRNSNTNYILKQQLSSGGGWYYNVGMTVNKKSIRRDVHRLVAETFLDRVEGKNYVNHINNVSTDNRVENLEWCTQKENIQHCVKQGRLNPINGALKGGEMVKKKIYQYNLEGNLIRTYPSLTEASKAVNRSVTSLSECCHGKQHTSAGFIWRYD